MEHKIDPRELHSPQADAMTHAISTCVHCGFCLPACPTYGVLGEEMDSPRGRIVLMRGVLENSLPLADATPYIDRCLGCLGCVTACPSGVPYGELVTSFRAHTENQRRRPAMTALARWMARQTLPFPNRFRWAAWMGRLVSPLTFLMPGPMRAMLELVPQSMPRSKPLPAFTPAQGDRRGKVGLVAGCVQQVIAPEINWATIRVLSANGFDVVIPEKQGCCGSLSMHTGDSQQAKRFASHNFQLFSEDVDAIITNAAGCGSGMKEYPLLFEGDSRRNDAIEFSEKLQDVCQFLAAVGIVPPRPWTTPLRLAYHDACHLAHAQRIVDAPRELLRQIPGVTLFEIADGDICCGSAGTYNMEQPEIAKDLGNRKAKNIASLNVEAVVMGNIGCMVQIENHLNMLGEKTSKIQVLHTIQVLDLAYQSEPEASAKDSKS